jgi:hypothetical protein
MLVIVFTYWYLPNVKYYAGTKRNCARVVPANFSRQLQGLTRSISLEKNLNTP